MWFPDWLYERLPMLYLAAGGACVLFLGTSFATLLSAVLLVGAAFLTHRLRSTARGAAAARNQRRASARRARLRQANSMY